MSGHTLRTKWHLKVFLVLYFIGVMIGHSIWLHWVLKASPWPQGDREDHQQAVTSRSEGNQDGLLDLIPYSDPDESRFRAL